MPELPEVETIVRQLNQKIKNSQIEDVWFDWPKLIQGKIKPEEFGEIIKKRRILKVSRRGKNIFLELTQGFICLIHLKLTGRILVSEEKEIKKDSFIHFYFRLADGNLLALSDRRKFAKIILDKKENIFNLPEIKKLGPDPLTAKLTPKQFYSLINQRRKNIKQVLMEQKIIAGIGNIYANEILWEAGINPLRMSNQLTFPECAKILQAIKKVLLLAIKHRGATIADETYQDIQGRQGGYGKLRQVYQREGEKCSRCQKTIKRILSFGRSTFYCSSCQK